MKLINNSPSAIPDSLIYEYSHLFIDFEQVVQSPTRPRSEKPKRLLSSLGKQENSSSEGLSKSSNEIYLKGKTAVAQINDALSDLSKINERIKKLQQMNEASIEKRYAWKALISNYLK